MTKKNTANVAIESGCPLDRVLRLLSGEWTIHILWILAKNGPTRYGELQRLVDGISSKVLTDRLRMLEEKNVIYRDHEPSVPPKVTYGLTELGQELDQTLRTIEDIAKRWP